jgi:hypothetical protein
MRLTICIFASAVLLTNTAALGAKAKTATFQLHETTWTFMDGKTKVQQSINDRGVYVENAVSGKHIDHGTAVMKGGKACFTSAMTKDGEECWTTHPTAIGQSMTTTNDKGRKLKVTRVKYVAVAGY